MYFVQKFCQRTKYEYLPKLCSQDYEDEIKTYIKSANVKSHKV